ncbi:MAG: MFS transporter [Sphaerochaetaceae bacterium]|nr:MFS transporter [Spirochaetales bacterium]MDY5500391.1 MFS transporter [Sphaerochaetaceae bacterium]
MRSYRLTAKACYLSYVVQALVINLPPLLFASFARLYGINERQMGFLILLIFSVQIVIDLLSTPLSRLLGYRGTMLLGHASVVVGLVVMAFFRGFHGLVVSLILQGLGSGVVEVLISPIIQYMPDSSDKDHMMSLLHSFYCWGMVVVIAFSTLLFRLLGEARWFLIPLLWIPVPFVAFLLFLLVPIAPVPGDGKGQGIGLVGLVRQPVFWILLVMMPLGSSSEQAVSQWVSYYAELGLGVTKLTGDLAGPCLFALMQGLCRLWYSRETNLSVEKLMVSSTVLCMAGYFFIVHGNTPVLSLLGCAMVGFAVGCFWPGTFSLSARHLPGGGTLLFSLLAFAGDVGCGMGPQVVAWAPSVSEGLSHAIIFPALLAFCLLVLHRLAAKKADNG